VVSQEPKCLRDKWRVQHHPHASAPAAHPARRTAHVDVNDIGTQFLDFLGRQQDLPGIIAENLEDHRPICLVVVQERQRSLHAIRQIFDGHKLSIVHRRAESPADGPGRDVSKTGHRRQDYVSVYGHIAYEEQRFFCQAR
jgi:hypothetical protein